MRMYLRDHPNADLVFAQMSQIDDFGRGLGPKKVGPVGALLTGNPFGACFLYRRSVYCDLGDYNADWELVEDYEYWLGHQRGGIE